MSRCWRTAAVKKATPGSEASGRWLCQQDRASLFRAASHAMMKTSFPVVTLPWSPIRLWLCKRWGHSIVERLSPSSGGWSPDRRRRPGSDAALSAGFLFQPASSTLQMTWIMPRPSSGVVFLHCLRFPDNLLMLTRQSRRTTQAPPDRSPAHRWRKEGGNLFRRRQVCLD